MGVDVTHIIGCGVLMNEKQKDKFKEHVRKNIAKSDDEDEFEDYFYDHGFSLNCYKEETTGEHESGIIVLQDGMCGEYIFIGRVEMISNIGFSDPIEIGSDSLSDEEREKLAQEINELFICAIKPEQIKKYYIPHHH